MMTTLKKSLQIRLGLLLGVLAGLLVWSGAIAHYSTALAAIAPSQQSPIEMSVQMGTPANELKFVPNHLEFEAGKRYTLILSNPSAQKHYFTAKDFADVSWTQKVEAAGVEVKGAVHELELKPGAEAEWVFVPQKPGTYELHCSIPGHAEAGMVGDIVITE